MTAPAQHPPHTLTLNPDGMPPELRALDQWVCWRWEHRPDPTGGKWTKVPIDPRPGRRADSTDRATWSTFALACRYRDEHRGAVAGVGFVFSADDEYVGIDVDKAGDAETGEISPEAAALIDRFPTFAEWSISGTGVHLIGRGSLPAGGNRTGRIEAYDRGRFFVMSGNPIASPDLIGDVGTELAAWHAEVFPAAYAPKPEPRSPIDLTPLSIPDEELLRCCQGSAKFRRLWEGTDGEYGDDTSRADLAFCNIAVRNGGDRDQVDALYRRSNRARPKWDQRRGERTYGEWTLDQAFDGTVIPFTQTSQPPARQNRHLAGLPSDDLPDDVASLKAIVIDLRARVITAEARAERAEHRAAAAEARADALSHLQHKTVAIIRNKSLSTERFTAIALAYRLGNRESAGDTGDEHGLYPMSLTSLGKEAGISADTAGDHVGKLEDEGLLRRDVRWVDKEYVDPKTGEIRRGYKETFIGLPEGRKAADFIEAVATWTPEKKRNWGGSRLHCTKHPDADVIKTTVWTCGECGDELHREIETIRPNRQDDDLVDEGLAATGTDGPQHRRSMPQRGLRPHRYRNGPASHNDGPSPAEVERAYQQLNAIPAIPADRYTDVAIGRNP